MKTLIADASSPHGNNLKAHIAASLSIEDKLFSARDRVVYLQRDLHPSRSRCPRFFRGLIASFVLAVCFAIAPPLFAQDIDDDQLLLLDFTLERQRVATSVTAYGLDDGVVISLSEVGGALEFPILVDAQAGRASGWFIHPDRTFLLDFDGGFVEIEGQRTPFSRDEVFVYDGAILVTSEALSRWFPVDLRFDMSTLSVAIEPRERLPLQERQARRRAGQQLGRGVGPATLPLIETPYGLVGPYAADVGLGYSIRRNEDGGKATTGLNYSALLAGDLAYMDSRIFLGGNHVEPLSSARMTLSRDQLGLPLGLRYVEIGDIVPAIVSGTGFTSIERGVLIQGGGSIIGRDDLIDSDTININGDALEGWDVELFQGGMRIGFQTVGSNGRYQFPDIEPLAGENVFELVFYGPSGERRSETVTRYSGLTPDLPGSVRYQLSVSQKGEQLFDDRGVEPSDLSDRGSTRIAAGAEVRVLPALALRGSWNSVMVDGERLNYYSVGARTAWRDINLGVDAIRDPLGGTRWDASLQIPAALRAWGFDTRFSHTHYANYERSQLLDSEIDPELRLRSRTGVTLNGPIGPLATRFSLFHNREPDRTSNSASAGFTSRAGDFTFGNTLNYFQLGRSDAGQRSPDRLTGNLFLSTRAHPLSLRAGVRYTLKPDSHAEEYFIDSNLRVASDMSMTFELTRNPLTRLTRYTSGFNWRLPQLTLSPRLNYDSDGQFSGFVYASFSLASRPDRAGVLMSGRSLASYGAVAGRAFVDHDASGTFSAGDEPLPDVKIRAPQAFSSAQTDAKGVAYLTGLPSGRTTDVVLSSDTLPSADMTSVHPGNAVSPRPTRSVLIDFPVVPTGEIDGRVLADERGSRRPLAGAMVELVNASGVVVDFKVSAYDGFFIFSDVPHARYTLRLAGRLADTATSPHVLVDRDKNIHSGVDVIVTMDTPTVQLVPSATVPVAAPRAQPIASPPAVQAVPRGTTAATLPVRAERPNAADNRQRSNGAKDLVQLGAFSLAENARKHLQSLSARGILEARQMEVVAMNAGARGTLHRVLARPQGGTADALCDSVKARGAQCFTVAQ